ncbi:MAG: AmmeMemoRadiSam system radical SAM enzyme [Alphaproteobacteria bacterium]|nr:AmmeMemoRadiSam system radical SAM enzyme [Alphaproteobacteria bacterium]
MSATHTGIPGRWWSRTEDGKIRCDLCPRACTMNPGQRGFCYVRRATEEGVRLETWGRSSGFCVDPIEKKPLNHFLPGTPILSFGTAGCNLGCRFCQNWDISKAKQDDALMDSATPEDLVAAAKRTGSRSIAFTYNDPVIFAEYAIDVAKACRPEGIRTVAVTAGYISPEPRQEFYAHMDAANIDLKAFTEDFYHRLCFAHLQPVLETIEEVVTTTDCWVELTTLLIPGENDSNAEIERLSTWVADHLGPDVPLHFTAYHPDFKLTNPATPHTTLRKAREIAKKHGLHHVYTGNVHDPEGQSTWCPSCGERVIERDGYTIGAWRLTAEGACARCGTAIAGRWDPDGPGRWGARRMPVRIH